MTKDEQFRSSLKALEANYNSPSGTPTIITPSTSPSHISRPSSGRSSPHPTNLGPKSRSSPPPHSSLSFVEPSAGDQHRSEGDSDAEDDEDMTDGRPPFHRPTDGRSQTPLLKDERGRPSYDSSNGSARPAFAARRSTFRSRSPDMEGSAAVKKKYAYAAFFLIISLISFVIQTETAVYIQHELHWNKAYAML